jgi:hypothetical protein
MLADGGFTDWTQLLLGDRRWLMTSATVTLVAYSASSLSVPTVNSLTGNSLTVSISDSLKPGEKITKGLIFQCRWRKDEEIRL